MKVMATEIERKFLLLNDSWQSNIKSATLGISRTEFEYSIPIDDALLTLNDLCIKPIIEKTRYTVSQKSHAWGNRYLLWRQ